MRILKSNLRFSTEELAGVDFEREWTYPMPSSPVCAARLCQFDVLRIISIFAIMSPLLTNFESLAYGTVVLVGVGSNLSDFNGTQSI